MKKTIKIFSICIIIIYLLTFVNRNNYYESNQVLSDEAIRNFEEDLREGKTINPNNYLPKKKNYNNRISIFFFNISKIIEKIVNHSLKKAIQYIENWQNKAKLL